MERRRPTLNLLHSAASLLYHAAVREDDAEAAKAREEPLSGAAGKAQTLTQKTSDWQPLNTTLQPERERHTNTQTHTCPGPSTQWLSSSQ